MWLPLQHLSIWKVPIKIGKRNMKTKIFTKHGEIGAIAALLGCSRVTVRAALNGRTDSALARAIRKVAIERGAAEEGKANG